MEVPLWCYDAGRQALIFFDPARNGQGTGFHIPAVERTGEWQPSSGLELALRKTLPLLPSGPMIQPAAAMPSQFRGISPNGSRRGR
jgi:hypothetical protein